MVSKNHSSPNEATDEADLPQNIIFNTKSQFMCSLTPQLTLLDVSPSFSQAYGLQQRQAAGAKFAEVIWPEHTVLVESSLQDLTPEYRIMTFEQGNTSAEHLPRWQRGPSSAILTPWAGPLCTGFIARTSANGKCPNQTCWKASCNTARWWKTSMNCSAATNRTGPNAPFSLPTTLTAGPTG